jgi:hypothetical protein
LHRISIGTDGHEEDVERAQLLVFDTEDALRDERADWRAPDQREGRAAAGNPGAQLANFCEPCIESLPGVVGRDTKCIAQTRAEIIDRDLVENGGLAV